MYKLKVCINKKTDTRYDMYHNEDNNQGYVYKGFFTSQENVLNLISHYKNNDKLKLTNYDECEKIPELTWKVSISGGISKFWCSPDEVLTVKGKNVIFETWKFEAK